MRYIKLFFFLLAVVFSIVPQVESKTSDYCKVIDANGKVTFKKCIYRKSKPKTKTPETTTPSPTPKSTAPKVDIYYASWDPNSNKAILFFRKNHIVVNAFDIEHDSEAAARKKRIDPEFVGMPLVIINGVVIRGVNEKKYREALLIKPR